MLKEITPKYMEKNKYLKKWIQNEMTNFDYLIYLNQMGGRSYKDLTQYPTLPWVIKDFESPNLDLNNINSYRELNKTMGALGSE